MEKWEEIYKNVIPSGKYQTLLKNGEESGLIIQLKSNEYTININFGVVVAFRMLDEGTVIGQLFEESELTRYKTESFSNIIYRIQGGEFEKFIKHISNELHDFLEIKQYLLVTMNYIIEVATKWEPSIEVLKCLE